MNTEKLYEFLILSQTLNYTTAANNLYISQSVLSKHIKDMEDELQLQLLNRNTHGVSLTAAGQLLAQEAPALIQRCDHALSMVQIKNLPIAGKIRAACVVELSYASHMQVFISRFMEHYPEIELTVDVCCDGTPENVLPEYDFLFTPCEYPALPPNVHCCLIQTHGTYIALYPGHRLFSKSLLQLRDLAGETILVPLANELFGPYAKNWLLVKKYTHNQVNCIVTPNLSSALFHVSIGKGITIIPRYVKNMLPSNIFMVGLSSPECRFNEYLYYNEKNTNGAAKLFYEEFRNTYADK